MFSVVLKLSQLCFVQNFRITYHLVFQNMDKLFLCQVVSFIFRNFTDNTISLDLLIDKLIDHWLPSVSVLQVFF